MIVEETLDYMKAWDKPSGRADLFKSMSELIIMTASRTLLGKEIRSKLDESGRQDGRGFDGFITTASLTLQLL